MRAILLGAGRGVSLRPGGSTPKCLLEGLAGWRVLDWLLNALREGGGVEDITFVGGDGVDRIREAYPDLDYVLNENWAQEHVIGSLFAAESRMDRPFYFSYSDIVYRPATVDALRRSPGDIAIVVDQGWRHRYRGRSEARLRDAEKVVLRDGRVSAIGKDLPLDAPIAGEFIGLARFSERGAAALRGAYRALLPLYRHRAYRGAANLHGGHLTDLLQELIDQGASVDVVFIDGDWAELDVASDLSQFVFGTKAETLERLRPMLQGAHISEGIRLRVGQWLQDPQSWAANLATRFPQGPVAVRSSARGEDSLTASNAGRYHSVIGVEGGNAVAIAEAVDRVVASYERDDPDPEDQILIQPCLTDVAMSGVMMTRDLDTGADYTVVHYDDESGRTDSVTAGASSPTRTVRLHRGLQATPREPRLAALLETAGELEAITGSDALDVEFAFTRDEQLHVLQVRPIAAREGWRPVDARAVAAEMEQLDRWLRERLRPVPGLAGSTTILGQMPDWNPAEMIGPFPQPLARSLYEALITNRAWRVARAELGYGDPFPHRLMVALAGRPYIDVRLSANNLLPAALDPAVAHRVVDAALERLRDRPELHDKLEFEVLPTCLDFRVDAALQRLRAYGLPESDLPPLRAALHGLTRDLLREGPSIIERQLGAVARLAPACDRWMQDAATPESHPARIAQLVEHTVRDGTIPFSILARLAFVGTSLLRTLGERDALRSEEIACFQAGIRTVSGEMMDADRAVRRGELPRASFLKRFGHLRPGSYDLLSPRYDRAPELYFPERVEAAEGPDPAPFQLRAASRTAIDALLRELDLGTDAEGLLDFIARAIAAREEAKFAFTRNLSTILELVADWGAAHDLSREEMVSLEIGDVLRWANQPTPPQLGPRLLRRIGAARMRRELQAKILLPVLITDPEDLQLVRETASRANFVTRERVEAPLVVLDRLESAAAPRLEGKVVLIEGADPGYDWIFAHRIAGLVTRFGGANSHMTIRCAEFGLPAAIGCGEELYERLRNAHAVQLDCGGETIHVLA